MSVLNRLEEFVRPDCLVKGTEYCGSMLQFINEEIIEYLDPKTFISLAATNKTWQSFLRYLLQMDMASYDVDEMFAGFSYGFSCNFHRVGYTSIDGEHLNDVMSEFEEFAFRNRPVSSLSPNTRFICEERFPFYEATDAESFEQHLHAMKLYDDYALGFDLFRAWWFMPHNINDITSWDFILSHKQIIE